MSNPLPLPLEGLRVIDMTEVWAGPMTNSLLGDLGAMVIKVESFPRSSLTRLKGTGIGYSGNDPGAPQAWDRAALHNMANRNKYGVTLNIKHPKGMNLLKDLVRVSDVFTESFTAGTAARLSIDYPDIKKIRSDIVMLSMSGWGSQGPYKGYAALGSTLDGFTGHHSIRGYPNTDPSVTPIVQHTDAVGSVMGALAILMALHYRQRTGKGQWIDLSQVESFLPHLGEAVMDYVMNKRSPSPLGNAHGYLAPYGCYQCRGEDNWIVINVTSEKEWLSLCRVVRHEEWSYDPRYADPMSRFKYQTDLNEALQSWTMQQDKMYAMTLLQKAGVPAEAVLDDVDLYTDPHLKARGFFQKLTHAAAGEHRYPGYLWKFNNEDHPIRLPPNCLGEHNDFVYGELLGLSITEIQELRDEGTIGENVPTDVI